jgi:hypothetical protein
VVKTRSRLRLTVVLALVSFPVTALASRAELDGWGFPHLLAIDPSNVVLFPGSAAFFGKNALVDYTGYDANSFEYYNYWNYPPPPEATSLVTPVDTKSDNFGTALAGKHLVFGYALDGLTHNLILSHPSGWGVTLGISDQYHEQENSEVLLRGPLSEYRSNSVETSRRDVRLAAGWSKQKASGRLFEVCLGVDFVNTQFSSSTSFTDIDTTIFNYSEWKSEPGIGLELKLRSVSPEYGFQSAVRVAYEDLQPEVISGPPANWIRRYALVELGWRTPFHNLQDVAVGVVMEWSHDTIDGLNTSLDYTHLGVENKRYYGQLFAAAQRQIAGTLVGRAGIHGEAHYQEEQNFYVQNYGSQQTSTIKRSEGRIESPQFFLGLGWNWKKFQLDGRLSESLSISYPLSQWSIQYSW